jgi:glyoxylase-like metal-dependent hydrolase (beta-lactamase superfamily II)
MSGLIVHHLDAGTMCPLAGPLLRDRSVDPSLWRAKPELVCHCWLIESDAGLILVDTGLGTQDRLDPEGRLGRGFTAFARPSRDPSTTAVAQVRALGFDPAEVRHIVPTHLDLDHAGGLPDFPDATVHVFADEHAAAMAPLNHAERQRYRPSAWAHGPRWQPRSVAGEAWFGFDGVRAIDGRDDILLIPLQGHSRGHCGVAVRSDRGWLLHAGDAYFAGGEKQTPPSCPSGLALFQRLAAADDALRRSNQDRLRALVREHGHEVTVHCAHCPVEFDALVG